jgi:hypothetical protein
MSATKTTAGKTARRTTTEIVKAEVVTKEVKKAVESKKTLEMIRKIGSFDEKKASSYDRLMDTKRRAVVNTMFLKQMRDNFLSSGVNLTDKQREVLTYKNIITFVKGSRYCDLQLFTPQQMVYICSGVIKLHDDNTARAERAAKQNEKESAK